MFQLRQSFLLFLTATIWGSGFVAQSVGMDHVTPFTFTFFRTLLGSIVLLPLVYWIHCRNRAQCAAAVAQAPLTDSKVNVTPAHSLPVQRNDKRDLFWGSLFCGLFLVGGESFQQFGLVTTDASKAGFITSMYIIFVPLIGLFIGKKLNAQIVIGVVLSVVGLYLLCIKDSFTLEQGDILILICAVVFAFHILCIDYYVQKCDGVYLSCGQFFAASVTAFILMLIFDYDVFSWEHIYDASVAILWAGIMSNGIAYTLQVVGQRGMNPTIATLILSLESVMAVVFGTLLLDEKLSPREGIGCFLILSAVLIAQISPKQIWNFFSKRHTDAATTNNNIDTDIADAAVVPATATNTTTAASQQQ